VALRLPPTVLGIDADMYEGKAGRATLAAAISAWGELPDTWRTGSRRDGSGILLFQIPEGLAWPGKLPQGGGVELIRWDHRYAVVGPSRHDKTGEEYFWSFGANIEPVDEFPDNDTVSIPGLPETWVTGLTSGKKWTEREALELDADDVRLWLSDRRGPELCAEMNRTLTRYLRLIRTAGDDGGSHDAGRDGAWAIIGDAHAGHAGVETALKRLKRAFRESVSRRSDDRLAREEWARIVVRGVQKVAAEGEANGEDLCALLAAGAAGLSDDGSGNVGGGSGSSHLHFARTDAGNAERLVTAHRHEQKFISGLGWFIWSPEEERWVADTDGAVNRRAIGVARAIAGEAEFLAEEDPKAYSDLIKFARASENLGKLKAMVDLSASLSGMTLPQSAFDANPARLGRVLLKPNPGVEVTPALPEHRITMRLGTAYVPGSRSKEWNRFLAKVQPDEEIRDWLQRLLGYSLYGGNKDRLFVANFGGTSTGKTTFLGALLAALGEYVGMVNMTVYRDNQDDKPRPDLLRALRKRLVFSEETSSAWHLHADQVKRLTGGAPISARGMRSNEFVELIPAFVPWIFVNSPPTIEGADLAVLRRLVVVPWDVLIPKEKEDSGLADRLKSDANRAAVLAWALEGWTAYAARPDLSAPLGTLYARSKFLSELSDFDRALVDIAVVEPDAWCLPSALFQAYRAWCTSTNSKAESNTKFGTFLNGRGYVKKGKKVDGKHTWVRVGLRLSGEYERLFSSA
jgi:putative DNA primase/helicase